jgi:GntR family transcriptional regulator, transcriptional repressor for pyruvate dehydrogenase complex
MVENTVDPMGQVGRRVRVPKSAELVAAQLRRQIVRGELVEGDSLPPEAALLEQFGVSRPTLREAFRVLESEALISVRRGARGGATVHSPSGDVAARYAAMVLEHRDTTLADLYEASAILEPPCAARLAGRRSPDDVARLRAAAGGEAADDDPLRLLARQTAFHTLVVELAGSPTVAVLAGMVSHIADLATWPDTPVDAGAAARAARKGRRAHRRLVELIERATPRGPRRSGGTTCSGARTAWSRGPTPRPCSTCWADRRAWQVLCSALGRAYSTAIAWPAWAPVTTS